MIKQYFNQAIAQLRQHPLISLVSVLGTALAIFLIMLVVMLQQVKVAPFSPESNRDRFLHVQSMSIANKEWGEGNTSNGPMGVKTAEACFKQLTLPEAVTIYGCMVVATPVSMPKTPAISADLRQTDAVYWHVFDFAFTDGKPYDQATFEASRPVAVMTESIARALFGTIQATGREFLLNHAPYQVVGVVKDVSPLATTAYGQVWVPYTSTDFTKETWSDEHMGMMCVTLLARNRDDFDAIRAECEKLRQQYDRIIADGGYNLVYRNRPYNQEKQAIAFVANEEPDLSAHRRQRVMMFAILLLVPAINLSSMTHSRLRQRVAEIGVRRSFGCTRMEMVWQIIAENLVVTLMAGAVGLLFSLAFAYWGNALLFAQPFSQTLNAPDVSLSILLHTSTFVYALGFCFLLNLLSSGLPAWRASRISIVDAIGGRLH